MAAKIRGVTIQLNGDTSGLEKSLQSTNKEIKNTQNQLKDVERLLKLDPKNTELLRQKQELLGKAIGETKGKLDTLKKAEENMKANGVDKNSEQFQALQREIIATENELKDLTKEAKNTTSAFDKIGDTAKKVGDAADNVAQKTAGLSTAAAGLVAGMGALGLKTISAADDLATLSTRTGISTEQLQKFAYASDMVDVSTEELATAFSKMKRQMDASPEAFEALGVSVKNADGTFRDLESVFYDSLAALSQIEDETQRDITAMEIFGKGADSLATIIDDGGEALKEYGQKAEDMGLILSEDTIGKLTETGDKIDELKATAMATMAETGAKLVDELAPTIEMIIEKVGEVISWIGSLDGDTLQLIMTVGLAIAAISPVAKVVSGITKAIGGVSKAITFLLANPMVAMIAAVVGFVALIAIKGEEILNILNNVDSFLQNIFTKDWSEQFGFLGQIVNGFLAVFGCVWDGIKQIFNGIIDFIRGVFTGDWERALNGLGSIFSGVFEGIRSVADRLTDWLSNIFSKNWSERFGFLGQIVNGFLAVFGGAWDGAKQVLNGVIDFIRGVFTGDWQRALSGLGSIFSSAFEGIRSTADRLRNWLSNIFSKDWSQKFAVFGNIINAFGKTVTDIFSGVEKTFSGIVSFIKSVFAGDWKAAWTGIKDVFGGIFDTIGSIAKAPINAIIGLLNGLIDGMNWVIRGINSISVEIPDWVPFVGGSRIGFNLGEIGKLAYLARGGVLEAGSAIVGEFGPELLTMSPQGAVVQPLTNNTTNQNYGGVTLIVNGAPGQNIHELAEILMDEMGSATRRQEAVFG